MIKAIRIVVFFAIFAIVWFSQKDKRVSDSGQDKEIAIQVDTNNQVLILRSEDFVGYGGHTPVKISMTNNIITKVELHDNNETPEFVTRIGKEGFFQQFKNISVKDALEKKFDVVSGATMTTSSVVGTLKEGLKEKITSGEIIVNGKIKMNDDFDWHRLVGNIASLLVIAFSLLSFFLPKKFTKYRLWLLIATVLLLGFWQYKFLSITYLFNVVINNFSFADWIIPLMVLISVILPMFTNRSFYCMYLCPFGAAQELTSKIYPTHRIHIKHQLHKILQYGRIVFFLTIIVLLLLNIVTDFANFEPFASFYLNSKMPIAIIIAVIALVISKFIPRFWCKYCCPTGFVINIPKN